MKFMTLQSNILAGILILAGAGNALADHNSPHGAGWANMTNDIHNTVIEDGLRGTAFRDFVSQGAGASSVNRYTAGTNNRSHSTRIGGMSRGSSGGGRGGRR